MKLIISDIIFIARRPLLLTTLLSPVIFTLFLLYIFPFISGLTRSDNALLYDRYYTMTAITLIAGIPFIYGLVFSFIHMKELHTFSSEGAEFHFTVTKSVIVSRMAISAVLSFILVLPVIYITDAVPTEGWLRSIYAAFLLSITTPLIYIFSTGYVREKKSWRIPSLICIIFLITVPSGLLLRHPWNYAIFFSPFYWTGWAWVIVSPVESMIYGMISMAITAILTFICFRYIIRNSGPA